ncbi:MAG: hypothetical protein ACOYW3_01820 [Bacteroidota bacterium]
MALVRLLLIGFNVAVITYLVYRMLQVYEMNMEPSRKRIILVVGVLLVLAPVSIVVGVVRPSPLYLLIYPVAVSLFIYLVRESK